MHVITACSLPCSRALPVAKHVGPFFNINTQMAPNFRDINFKSWKFGLTSAWTLYTSSASSVLWWEFSSHFALSQLFIRIGRTECGTDNMYVWGRTVCVLSHVWVYAKLSATRIVPPWQLSLSLSLSRSLHWGKLVKQSRLSMVCSSI